MTKSLSLNGWGIFFVYIILGLLSVNLFSILVIWKILRLHLPIITQMSNSLGFANYQPISYL